MFGLLKKRIPAPEGDRRAIVRRLFVERSTSDPGARVMALHFGINPAELPIEALMQGSPEASILRIVEQYLTMQDQGATEEFAVKSLNQFHRTMLSVAGQDLSELQRASTLFQYVRHFIDLMHSQGGEISDHFLLDTIQEIKSFYKR